MGFRVRKSFKVMPGMRMTVTPRGVSASFGVTGARISAHSSGRVTRTVGIPGSGISDVKQIRPARMQNSAPPRAPRATKPGLLAPKWEKDLFAAVNANSRDDLGKVGRAHSEAQYVAGALEGLLAVRDGDTQRAAVILQWAWDFGGRIEESPFVQKYLTQSSVGVPVAQGVTATLPICRDAIGLILVEVHQELGDIAKAIEVAESLDPSAVAAVSLAELYVEALRYDDVIDLTNGVENTDDASALLLTYRGLAFNGLGHPTAAREALTPALKSKKRDPAILHLALLERSHAYLGEGKKAMARKDLERILAEDSNFPNIRESIAQVGE